MLRSEPHPYNAHYRFRAFPSDEASNKFLLQLENSEAKCELEECITKFKEIQDTLSPDSQRQILCPQQASLVALIINAIGCPLIFSTVWEEHHEKQHLIIQPWTELETKAHLLIQPDDETTVLNLVELASNSQHA